MELTFQFRQLLGRLLCISDMLQCSTSERLVCPNQGLTDTGVGKTRWDWFLETSWGTEQVCQDRFHLPEVLEIEVGIWYSEMGQGGRAELWRLDTLTGVKTEPEEKLMCIRGEGMSLHWQITEDGTSWYSKQVEDNKINVWMTCKWLWICWVFVWLQMKETSHKPFYINKEMYLLIKLKCACACVCCRHRGPNRSNQKTVYLRDLRVLCWLLSQPDFLLAVVSESLAMTVKRKFLSPIIYYLINQILV